MKKEKFFFSYRNWNQTQVERNPLPKTRWWPQSESGRRSSSKSDSSKAGPASIRDWMVYCGSAEVANTKWGGKKPAFWSEATTRMGWNKTVSGRKIEAKASSKREHDFG